MHALGYIITTVRYFQDYSMWYTHVAMETVPIIILLVENSCRETARWMWWTQSMSRNKYDSTWLLLRKCELVDQKLLIRCIAYRYSIDVLETDGVRIAKALLCQITRIHLSPAELFLAIYILSSIYIQRPLQRHRMVKFHNLWKA